MRHALRLPLHLIFAAALFVLLTGGARAQDVQPLPALTAHVTDTIGLLPADRRAAVEARLAALEREKGAQVAVLLVATTRPEAIEEYSIRVAEAWRLGRRSVDDGVLFVVARDDRRMRIEVGRGLEGAIPDAIAKRIIAEVVTPHFKAGDFPGGVEAGVEAIAARVSGEPLPAPVAGGPAGDAPMGFEEVLVLGMIGTIVIGSVLRAVFGRLLGATLAAGIVTFFRAPLIERMQYPVRMFDAMGLALFAVDFQAQVLAHRHGPHGPDLQVEDDHSRFILASHVARAETAEAAISVVATAISRHGAPAKFLTDNGTAFNQSRRGNVSQLETFLRRQGVTPITGRPSKPTTQGKNERLHQTVQKFLDAHRPIRTTARLVELRCVALTGQ